MLAQYFNYPRLVCAKTLRKALGSRLWEISFDQLGDFAHWPKKEALFCGETERNEKKKKAHLKDSLLEERSELSASFRICTLFRCLKEVTCRLNLICTLFTGISFVGKIFLLSLRGKVLIFAGILVRFWRMISKGNGKLLWRSAVQSKLSFIISA